MFVFSTESTPPTGEVLIEPVQTLDADMIERNVFAFPQNLLPHHLPRPVGSSMCSSCNMGTRVLVDIVIDPPDWNVSFFGTSWKASVGKPNESFAAPKCLPALEANSVQR